MIYLRRSMPRTVRHLKPIGVHLLDCATFNKQDVCYSFCRFISETKKETGEDLPTKTIRHLILAIQMYLFSMGFTWKLLDDLQFHDLKMCIDNVMKEKATMGLGAEVK